MRIRIFSDLHVDVSDGPPPPIDTSDCDVIVVAGDVSEKLSTRALGWLQANVLGAGVPAVFVPGNHDFYRSRFPAELDRARPLFEAAGIHLLARGESVTIGDTLFVGATLWTDYKIAGDQHISMLAAGSRTGGMNDHRLIRGADGSRPFLPKDALEEHQSAIANIRAALAGRRPGQAAVVVSHHGPSPRSLRQGTVTEVLDAAYASDLEEVIAGCGPDLWIHGHVHRSQDYELGWTRVVANPAGYRRQVGRGKDARWELENPDYDPKLTIDLPKYGYRIEAEADIVVKAMMGKL